MDKTGIVEFGVTVEILLKRQRNQEITTDDLNKHIAAYIGELPNVPKLIKCKKIEDDIIQANVEEITIGGSLSKPFPPADVSFFSFTINEHRAEIETIEGSGDADGDDVAASNHWMLPNREFQGLWESLIYQKGLKENILKFAKTIMLFSQRNIDANIISCNKLVLLHGPPGTGKTSLCKALAHKLSIHLKHIYTYTHLYEINSHSLFSKWFSESGKLVLKLFGDIRSVADHNQSFVVILIDEVESIAYARDTVSANEPSDSLRVVNAVLTQLDQLRTYPNVLVLTTSNLTSTIDLAFIDRADLKQFIGPPSAEAIYEIYAMAIQELIIAKIITQTDVRILPYHELVSVWDKTGPEYSESLALLDIAMLSDGLSGRTLRKMPFLAHAWFIHTENTAIDQYLEALKAAVLKHKDDSQSIVNK